MKVYVLDLYKEDNEVYERKRLFVSDLDKAKEILSTVYPEYDFSKLESNHIIDDEGYVKIEVSEHYVDGMSDSGSLYCLDAHVTYEDVYESKTYVSDITSLGLSFESVQNQLDKMYRSFIGTRLEDGTDAKSFVSNIKLKSQAEFKFTNTFDGYGNDYDFVDENDDLIEISVKGCIRKRKLNKLYAEALELL